jgi:hypothetical protein
VLLVVCANAGSVRTPASASAITMRFFIFNFLQEEWGFHSGAPLAQLIASFALLKNLRDSEGIGDALDA